MATTLIRHGAWARLVLDISVALFAAGEISQVVKWRRRASCTDVRGEVVFRVVFVAAILMLPLGRALAPDAVLDGAAVFVGCGLMLGNWVGAAASFLLVLVGLIYRLLREEHAMIDSLGAAYLRFARDRARLVPFIW